MPQARHELPFGRQFDTIEHVDAAIVDVLRIERLRAGGSQGRDADRIVEILLCRVVVGLDFLLALKDEDSEAATPP
jgi:hypothetical protein